MHSADIVHRGEYACLIALEFRDDNDSSGIYPRCVGLANRDRATQSKLVKLGKVGYHTRLMDLHKSNSFGPSARLNPDEMPMSDAWYERILGSMSCYRAESDLKNEGCRKTSRMILLCCTLVIVIYTLLVSFYCRCFWDMMLPNVFPMLLLP